MKVALNSQAAAAEHGHGVNDVAVNLIGRFLGLGADLKWSFYVAMDAATRMQLLRLERCD